MSFEIGRTLEAKEPFTLDIASVITGRTFMASITRWGKSWTARKTVEECFGHAGIIIIDPEGEYASLREKYPFLIIGKDIPIQIETAEFMADKILETKISVIIDLSLTEEELGKEYVNVFLRRFFFLETTARQPYLVVIEEAEDFGPEKGVGTTTCLGIIVNLTKKGGKRGIGVLLIAHRPAWVSKGLISQCANKALGRVDWPGDLEVLEKYARVSHENIEKLPTLGKGEFCFTGDWVKETTFVKVGQVKTTHLGYTPEVIPPSPKELRGVIESLQKSLPEVIEKIKPTVVSTAEIEAKLRSEFKDKYENRIQAVLKTADEKAKRKYQVRIDRLQERLDKLSRSRALQPVAPITDVLEHPIVKTRMLELPDKARDLLVKIEREPRLTREQLAAFLTTSTNSVANLVKKINQVFHATVIIGDGKPIRYKSMLKRLFITDVADREIKELERLQNENTTKTERINVLEDDVRRLRSDAQQSVAQRNELEKLRQNDAFLKQTNTNLVAALDTAKGDIEQLKKEAEVVQKLRELLSVGTSGLDIEERLATFRSDLTTELQQLLGQLVQAGEKALPQIEALIDKKIKELTPTLAIPIPADMEIPSEVTVQREIPALTVQTVRKPLLLSTENAQGRAALLYANGFFDEGEQTLSAVQKEMIRRGWSKDPRLSGFLDEMCNWGYLQKRRTDRWLYTAAMKSTDARSKGLLKEVETVLTTG